MTRRTQSFPDPPRVTWAAKFVPATFDAAARSVRILLYSRGFSRLTPNPRDPYGAPVRETFSLEPEHMRQERMAVGIPLLADHQWGAGPFATDPLASLGAVLGKIEDIAVTEHGIEGTIRFSKRESIADIVRDVEDGILDGVSLGAMTYRAQIEEREGEPALWTWVDWELVEGSLTPIQADPRARTQSRRQRGSDPHEETAMNEGRKLAAEDEKEDKALAAEAEPEDKEVAAEPEDEEGEDDKVEARAQKLAAERVANVREARKLAAKIGVDPDKAEQLVLTTKTYAAAKLKMVDLVTKRQQSSGGNGIRGEHVEVVTDAHDKRKLAMALVLEHRMIGLSGAARAKPKLDDEVLQTMRRKRLLDLGEELLQARGMSTRGLSNMVLAERCLASSSDFPLLLADVAGKILLTPFEARRSPWREFAREQNVPDFKQIKLLRRSSAPPLKKIEEDGEVTFGGFSERQETAQLATYGVGLRFTRHMLVNDDLNAFATGALGLGDSVVDNRDNIMVGLITGSDVMADGYPLFHNAHANIVGTTGTDIDAIEAAEEMMANQVETLRAGTTRQLNLDLNAWFAARNEAVAIDKVVNPRFVATEAANAPSSMSLAKPIYWDNRLATSPRYYYGIDKGRSGLIYGGLEGDSQPRFSEAVEFDTDGLKLKVIDDFYGGLESWEWIVRVTV